MSGKTFVEEEHPRADNGQFTKKGSNNEKKLFSYSKTSINNDFNNGDEKDYSKIKEEYENAADEGLLKFINEQETNPNVKSTYTIGKPTQKHINDIKELLGIDVSDYKIVLDGNQLNHIYRRHGQNGNADHSMADKKDIARVGYILDNYDSINIAKDKQKIDVYSKSFRNSNGMPSRVIEITKRINGYYVVSEAIIDAKKKRIAIETTFKKKKK